MSQQQLSPTITVTGGQRLVRGAPVRPPRRRADAAGSPPAPPAEDLTAYLAAEGLFVQALCEDWTCELAWLRLATLMPREHERRYCYQRVLHLNLHNVVARVELARLDPIPALLLRMSGSVACRGVC